MLARVFEAATTALTASCARRPMPRLGMMAMLIVCSGSSFAESVPVVESDALSAPSPAEISFLRLCASSVADNTRAPLQNPVRKTLGELLAIVPAALSLQYQSSDWKSNDEIGERSMAILRTRPRNLWPAIAWSEGANFALKSFIASILTADGRRLRLEVSGYQVCIQDPAGPAWFFRDVSVDLWP